MRVPHAERRSTVGSKPVPARELPAAAPSRRCWTRPMPPRLPRARVLSVRPRFGYKGCMSQPPVAPASQETWAGTGVPPTLRWIGQADGVLRILDQTLLPAEVVFRDCTSAEHVFEAIRSMRVRGAPLIGVAAAYGLYLAARSGPDGTTGELAAFVRAAAQRLAAARPTAVNAAWALRRVLDAMDRAAAGSDPMRRAMLAEAHEIAREDAQTCRRIGELGAELIPAGAGVLTHCNAGALATVAWGTALAPMYVAHQQGRRFRVYVDETRPLLQGARLTAFELAAAGIEHVVICDSAAASLMKQGRVQLVLVGADRIACNGDTANKIGTYGLALAARAHGIPFYVAAPSSTFDETTGSGAEIPIEYRAAQELGAGWSRPVLPASSRCENPAFDVTPGELISGFVTEKGVLKPVSEPQVRKFLAGRG